MRVEARGDEEEVGEPVEEDADDLMRVRLRARVRLRESRLRKTPMTS